jgi:hypothetical protein
MAIEAIACMVALACARLNNCMTDCACAALALRHFVLLGFRGGLAEGNAACFTVAVQTACDAPYGAAGAAASVMVVACAGHDKRTGVALCFSVAGLAVG